MKHLPRIGRRTLAAAAIAVVAAGTLLLVARPAGHAADKDESAPKTAAGLDLVPADGVAVFSVRFADLWNHKAFKAAREKMTKEVPDFEEHAAKEIGVGLDEIERVTGLLPSIESRRNLLVFVTTTKPYDAKKVLAAVAPNASDEQVKNRTTYVRPLGEAIAFLDDRTFVEGPENEVRSLLKRGDATKEGPLSPALREAAGKHLLVAGLDTQALAKMVPSEPPSWAAALEPALKARSAVLTEDLGDEAQTAIRLTFAGESDAAEGEKAVNAALDLVRAQMVQALREAGKRPEMAKVVPLLEGVQADLRAAKVVREGSTVEATLIEKIDPEKTIPVLMDVVQKVRDAAARIVSMNNLKQLALATYDYNDSVNKMLPPAVYDKDGKPLLSWRVLVLPFIEQNALYKEFRLDEPWDSDHNKKLLEKMPTTFAPPNSQAFKDHEAVYQAIVGKGTAFEKPGLRFPADFTDGASNTILFVEAKKGVPWTKPEDVSLDDGKLLPKLGGLTEGGFMAALCDGSVRMFPLTMKESTLRIWATRNNGQVRPDPEK